LYLKSMKRIIVTRLILAVFVAGAFAYITISKIYQEAMEDLEAGRRAEARKKFEKILTISKTHSLSDNAQYWIGETYFDDGLSYDTLGDTVNARRSYKKAVEAFRAVFNFTDRETPKYMDAAYKIALTYFRMGEFEKAYYEAVKFIAFYPESKNVPQARELIAKIRGKQVARTDSLPANLPDTLKPSRPDTTRETPKTQ